MIEAPDILTRRVICVLALLIPVAACGSDESTSASSGKPGSATRPISEKPDAKTPPPPTPNIPAQIFVDTSGSMAGFFGASGTQKDAGKMLMAVHEELDLAISESGLKTAKKCTVGDAVKCDVPQAPSKLASPALYRESTSRLDKVIARTPLPDRIDPNNPPPPDPLDNAKVTLLITDGMAVAPESGGSATCATGADPTCIGTLLQKRIAEGFGVWLVGVLLPFNGTHFPERTLTSAYFDQTRAHVDQLKFDARNLGVTFALIGNLGTDGTSGKSTYRYQGYKPLIIFVFSRDAAVGRGLVDTVVKKLRAAPIQPGKMNPQDTVQSVELAPLSATAIRASRIDVASQKEQQALDHKFDPASLAEFKLQESQRFGEGLAQKAWCGANGRSMIYVDYERPGPSTLPSYFKEQVALVAADGAPAGSVAPPKLTGDRLLTGINCAPIPVGPDTTLGFTLRTQVSLDEPQLEKQWWSRSGWSGEDAWQRPERVYRLEDLVLPILKERATRSANWDRVVLHVKRD